MEPRYRVELANKIRGGRAVGNLWLVTDRGTERNRTHVVFGPQESEAHAQDYARAANEADSPAAGAWVASDVALAPGCGKCGMRTWSLDPRRGTCTPCSGRL